MQTDATPPRPRAHPSALRTLIGLVATGRSAATLQGSAGAAIQVRSERDENRRQHPASANTSSTSAATTSPYMSPRDASTTCESGWISKNAPSALGSVDGLTKIC